MEVGDTGESGGPALFERIPIFWPIVERRPEFPRFYREMIALRRAHTALRDGDTLWLDNSTPARVVSFLRRGAGEEILFTANLSSHPVETRVELPAGASFEEVTPAVPHPMQPGGGVPDRVARPAALPALGLDGWGFRIFRRAHP